MELLSQLNRAISYIEEHIYDDIALSDISKVTVYSSYHFGRLFYYIVGIPLSEYIRKRKLSLAAIEVQSSNIKVIDLAVKFGYESADSFTRAFVKQHGVTPTTARQMGVVLKIFPPLTFQIKIKGVQEMNCRIEQKEAFEVYGIEKIFKNDDLGNVSDFWDECHANGSLEKLPELHGIVGYNEYDENTVPYMICAFKRMESKTDGYKVVQVPKYTWAIFRYDGLDNHGEQCQIPQLFNQAYSEWLPTSGCVKADGPDIEIYGVDFEEVWIPVVKSNQLPNNN